MERNPPKSDIIHLRGTPDNRIVWNENPPQAAKPIPERGVQVSIPYKSCQVSTNNGKAIMLTTVHFSIH